MFFEDSYKEPMLTIEIEKEDGEIKVWKSWPFGRICAVIVCAEAIINSIIYLVKWIF